MCVHRRRLETALARSARSGQVWAGLLSQNRRSSGVRNAETMGLLDFINIGLMRFTMLCLALLQHREHSSRIYCFQQFSPHGVLALFTLLTIQKTCSFSLLQRVVYHLLGVTRLMKRCITASYIRFQR